MNYNEKMNKDFEYVYRIRMRAVDKEIIKRNVLKLIHFRVFFGPILTKKNPVIMLNFCENLSNFNKKINKNDSHVSNKGLTSD
jgi:hypothetical protein